MYAIGFIMIILGIAFISSLVISNMDFTRSSILIMIIIIGCDIITCILLGFLLYNSIPVQTVRVCNEDGVTLKTYSGKEMNIVTSDNVISFTCDGNHLSFTVDGFTNKNDIDYTVDIDDNTAKSLGLYLTVDGLAQ